MNELEKRMNIKNEYLSCYACRDNEAIRLKESDKDIRTDFFRDIDKIIYSLSYIRYIDKTQVFSLKDNDHISRRMIHVQMVSRIARTIGRALGLNEDLIEAASLGHDLGHVPFGHVGERILNDISVRNGEGYFNHNVQSARLLMNVEHNGNGSNICLQTLDAIMCHNGEIELEKYEPMKKDKDMFLKEYEDTYKDNNVSKKLRPMTLEGCVVRISDIISYIGRDIEDAVLLGVLKKEDIPSSITDVLGNNNSDIINTIITDIIDNSMGKPYIEMSPKVFKALKDLKKFNYDHIYSVANSKEEIDNYTKMFNGLFDVLLNQIENNIDSNVNNIFLKNMSKDYLKNTSNKRKVIDYIAGMTDDYFINEYNLYCKK
ncbi:MAG: HD domain-containing protein [Bacilli bacterium]|nr:HD domain-containing protein [Bacilli bacterium]